MRFLLAIAVSIPLSLAAASAHGRAASASASDTPAPLRAEADSALQVIVSTTADWDSVGATLQRYERDAVNGPWRRVGEPIPATVGRAGLGWGTGLHTSHPAEGPAKREGDGRAPAGVYRLSSAFGYAAPAEVPWIRLPYAQATPSIECVDDARSAWYNRRVDRDTVPAPDWNSHEEMRRPDDLYEWGVWVDHNSAPPAPGGGSCIFLHVWAGPTAPTSGCTSMSEANLRTVLAWLDPRARPVLVQLPRDVYGALRGTWELP